MKVYDDIWNILENKSLSFPCPPCICGGWITLGDIEPPPFSVMICFANRIWFYENNEYVCVELQRADIDFNHLANRYRIAQECTQTKRTTIFSQSRPTSRRHLPETSWPDGRWWASDERGSLHHYLDRKPWSNAIRIHPLRNPRAQRKWCQKA